MTQLKKTVAVSRKATAVVNLLKISHTAPISIITSQYITSCNLNKLFSGKVLNMAILFVASSLKSAHGLEPPLQAIPISPDTVEELTAQSKVLAPVLNEIKQNEQTALKFIPINGDKLDIIKKRESKQTKTRQKNYAKKLVFSTVSQQQIKTINSNLKQTSIAKNNLKPLRFIPYNYAESTPNNSDKLPIQIASENLSIGRPEEITLTNNKKNQSVLDLNNNENQPDKDDYPWLADDVITDVADLGPGTDEEYPFQDLMANVDGITLSIKSATHHNDNFFTTKDNRTTYIYEVLSPALSLEGDNERFKFSGGISSEIGLFEKDTADNYVDYNLNAKVSTRINEQVAVTLTSSAAWGHDARGSNDDVADSDSPNRYFKPSVGVKFNLGIEGGIVGLTIDGDITNTTYLNHSSTTGELEKEVLGLDVAVSIARGPELSFLSGIDFQYNNYEHLTGKSSQDLYYYIGVGWNPNDLFNFDGKIGGREKFFIKDETIPSYASVAWGLSMNWIPLEYSTYSLGTSMTTSDSTGSADLFSTRDVDISWSHKWADFIGTDLNSAYSWKTAEGVGQTKVDKTWRYGAKVGLSIDDWLKIALKYDHTSLMSNSSGSSYDQNKFLLSIDAEI
ncbi:MAG: outer membrane beta-barrel protein [Magnetococcales bacterium]|nr:outer membrane beta-barrel protein [Magnetococcales bacterium]